jgi:hypothetical protein
MKRDFIILLTSLMLIGLLGTASMSQEAGTWTQKADMPTARFIPGSAVVDGKIYVIGGAPVSMGATAVVEEYDPATDTWTTRACPLSFPASDKKWTLPQTRYSWCLPSYLQNLDEI